MESSVDNTNSNNNNNYSVISFFLFIIGTSQSLASLYIFFRLLFQQQKYLDKFLKEKNAESRFEMIDSKFQKICKEKIPDEEKMQFISFPTAIKESIEVFVWTIIGINSFGILLVLIGFFYTLKSGNFSVWWFLIQAAGSIPINYLIINSVDLRLQTLYVLTDQKFIKEKGGVGDLIFAREKPNPYAAYLIAIGFRYLHDVQEVENILKNAISNAEIIKEKTTQNYSNLNSIQKIIDNDHKIENDNKNNDFFDI
ncbi:hypothetical protein M0811_07125 [Anaeramoeba ignava]|uniref:Uncharacterized protein n=1 Tax=Anaeramoeba ignava TaxID=1746090 RepID=A0A9Q0LPJ1_ANAIG|nr:hypothetical protein M0811_07125 [Anaeramoeba ignava]